MPSYPRAGAIIGLILSTSLLAIVSASLSAIYNANGHQVAVEYVNNTGKLADCALQPSGMNTIPLTAPLFCSDVGAQRWSFERLFNPLGCGTREGNTLLGAEIENGLRP